MTAAPRLAWVALALVLCGVVCHINRLGDSPVAGTEPHRVLAAQAMNASGEFVVPTLYGKVYLAKPPLNYWQLALAERVTGDANPWVWRFPAALSAILFALVAALYARRWFDAEAGPAAAFACGFSFFALLPVWSQSRIAEIDGPNTAAAGIAALALLDIGFFSVGRRRMSSAIVLLLSVAALSLYKGPAGLLPVAAVAIGGSIATRRYRWLLRPAVWLPILLGVAALAVWAWQVSERVPTLSDDNRSGGEELAGRIAFWEDPAILLNVVLTPLALLGYALPLSAAPLFVGRTKAATFTLPIVRACVGACIAALVLCGLAMLQEPRYGYVVLPLLCPLVGAIVAAWRRGELDESALNLLRLIAAVFTIAMSIAAVVMIVMIRDQPDAPWAYWGLRIVLALGFTVGAIVLWDKRNPRVKAGAAVLVAAVLLAAMSHADYQVHRNSQRSAASAAPRLVGLVGRDAPVVAERMVMIRPELFYYAEVEVQRPPGQTIVESWAEVRGSWIVFHDRQEFDALDESLKAQLVDITRLPQPTEAVVARLPLLN